MRVKVAYSALMRYDSKRRPHASPTGARLKVGDGHCRMIGVIVVIFPSRWQRVAITALLVLPLLLVVVLSAPAWLVLPFLSERRCDAVLRLLGCLIDWIKAIVGAA
jgi:hypothetical protein